MKNKIILLALIMLLSVNIADAQVHLYPKASISYSLVDHIRLENTGGNHITYNLPDINVRTGLEYRYKRLSVFYDNQFWCNPLQHGSFSPEEVHFSIGASVTILKNIKISVEHTCWHSINSSGIKHTALYGGNETITLSYGY